MLYNMSYPQDLRGDSLPGRPRPMTRPKQRAQHPTPFDPEDLSRRLNVVLAEQKARSDRRRKARTEAERSGNTAPPDSARNPPTAPRAEKERAARHSRDHATLDMALRKPSQPAHDEAYVPKVAAAQFELTTTTAETKAHQDQIHKLSLRAMKFHLGGAGGATSTEPTAADQTRALRKALNERDKILERNQFQRDRVLEEAAEAEQERELRQKQHQMNSIEARLSGARFSEDHSDAAAAKRLSVGELLNKQDSRDSAEGHECAELQHNVSEHRVDWTQSDETKGGKIKPKPSSARLRKPESLWALKGRLGSLTKHGREEKAALRAVDEGPVATETPKSPKSPITEFFARLKVSH